MGKRARTVVWLTAGALTVGVLLGGALLARQPWRQSATLPGGHQLTLATTTYGKHRLDLDVWWQKLLRPVVPQVPPARLYEASLDPQSCPDPMLFWFEQATATETRGGRLTPAAIDDPDASALLPWPEVSDERGDSLGPIPMSRLSRNQGPSDVLTLPLVAFPRRGKQVRVRFYRRSPRVALAEFVAPNPDLGPHPTWTPKPFPIRQQAGDLECTLVKLVTGLNRAGKKAGAGTPTRTLLSLRLTEAGKPAVDWEPVQATLADATGNQFTPEEGGFERRGSDCVLKVPGALSPHEQAWKVRVELARHARARFTPGETWTVRGVSIPDKKSAPVGLRGRVDGVQLRLAEVTVPEADRRRARIRLVVEGMRNDHRLTLLARDDQRRAFSGYSTAESAHEQLRKPVCDFYLDLPPGARALDLTFAVQRSRYVEFLAAPGLPGAR